MLFLWNIYMELLDNFKNFLIFLICAVHEQKKCAFEKLQFVLNTNLNYINSAIFK